MDRWQYVIHVSAPAEEADFDAAMRTLEEISRTLGPVAEGHGWRLNGPVQPPRLMKAPAEPTMLSRP